MKMNRDVGKILLKLNTHCYEKGLKDVPISLKGIRNGKLTEVDRNIVVGQILKSGQCNIFLEYFLKNIDDDLQELLKQSKIQEIINNPQTNFYIYDDFDKEMLYLYLLSTNEEKYDGIMREILEKSCNEKQKVNDKENSAKEIVELKLLCEKYEKEIEQLQVISRQRREKIKELEIQLNMLFEKQEKMQNENEKLVEQLKIKELKIEEFSKKIENEDLTQNIEIEKEIRTIVIGKKQELDNIKDESVHKIDWEKLSEEELKNYDKILIIKENVPIAKLRKLKRELPEKVVFFESEEGLNNYITRMEEINENGSN